MPISPESGERLAVIGLLAVATVSSLWIREEADAAEAAAIRRERLLLDLQQQRVAPGAARQLDPRRFETLFDGRELCWEEGPAGRYLALRAPREERR